MRLKLRHALTLAQMTLAVVCLRLEFLNDVAQRGNDSRGLSPAFIFLLSLNFPVSVPLKFFLWGRLPTLWFDAVFVAAVGAFWYWVARRMLLYRERRTLFPFSRPLLRISADVLLFSMSAGLGWLVIQNVREYPTSLSPVILGWWSFIPTLASLLIWSLGIAILSGRDLYSCVRYCAKLSPLG